MKKVIVVYLFGLIVINFLLLAIISLGGWFLLGANKIQAEEYSPLDFISDCSKFEVIVGVDQNLGRYATFHYEFVD